MTPIDLHSKTRKELSQLARSRSIQRWHSMKKQDLIDALISKNKKENPDKSDPEHKCIHSHSKESHQEWTPVRNKKPASKLQQSPVKAHFTGGGKTDAISLHTANPSWVLAKWELTTDLLKRASNALGSQWHNVKPVLRIFEITSDNSTPENLLKHEIEIHGNVNHWYIYIDHAPATIVAQIGYLTKQGHFHVLAKSDRIEVKASIINHGEKSATVSIIDELTIEEAGPSKFEFQLDVELLLRGVAHPNAEIELEGDIIKANEQGKFEFRMELPNGRQMIPAAMITPDGEARKTIVIGVERSTKELEPQLLTQT